MSNLFTGLDPKDLVTVTKALINTSSVSNEEEKICTDLISYIQEIRPDAEITRVNNSFLVKINHGKDLPVIFAGHLDTVPAAEFNGSQNDKATLEDNKIYGLGSCDMKSGLAVMIALLADIEIPSTFVFYECEEIEAIHSGLAKINDSDPELLKGKWAILLEPTNGAIELGCQGTISVRAVFKGKRAHSARPWMGENAIHKASKTLEHVVDESRSQRVLETQGLTYSATLSVTIFNGGIARNVIPDHCDFVINHRYPPDVSPEQAQSYITSLLSGADDIEIIDNTAGAMPAFDHPIVDHARNENIELVPKVAWTDVARFYEYGVPALNCGPGDATFAHRADEHVDIEKLNETYQMLKNFIEN